MMRTQEFFRRAHGALRPSQPRRFAPSLGSGRLGRSALWALFALVLATGVGLLGERRAEARVLELYGDVYAGGMYGTLPKFNSVITQKPDSTTGGDFYADQSGALLGARVGIEVLYTDVYVQFDQFINLRGFAGSTLSPMIGWDLNLGSGKWTGTVGGYGGFVLAFPYTPSLPIDKGQIAKFGVQVEGQAGAEYNINRLIALQLIGTVGYHYMFAWADNVIVEPATGASQSTKTHGFHLMAKVGLRFHLGI